MPGRLSAMMRGAAEHAGTAPVFKAV